MDETNSVPKNFPRITPSLYYDDATAAIAWLCRAFGFEVRLKVQGDAGDQVIHSELVLGTGVIMVSTAGRHEHTQSPRTLGGANSQSIMVYVDDVEAHCRRARAAGAAITTEPETHDYGDGYWVDRSYGAKDCEGHSWWFTQRVRDR